MSDVWPIENVWKILKQDLDKIEINDVKSLRRKPRDLGVKSPKTKNSARDL